MGSDDGALPARARSFREGYLAVRRSNIFSPFDLRVLSAQDYAGDALTPKEKRRRDADEAAVASLISKHLCSTGRLSGQPQSFLDAWKMTPSGISDNLEAEPERTRRLDVAKCMVKRRACKPANTREVTRRLKCMETDPFATDNVAYTLSSSEESRRERKSRVQNATWFEYTAKVSRGELSVSTCADELRKKHKMPVMKRHVEEAVRRLKSGLDPMLWSECIETRGRKTLLGHEDEERLANYVCELMDKKVWFHWTLIAEFAEEFLRDQRGNEGVHSHEQFTHRWFRGFLKRHGLKVTKLATRDAQRTNSATEAAILHYFEELYALLVELDFAVPNPDYDPTVPYSRVLNWNEDKMHRVITGDETSCHLKLDGLRRFTYVSRVHERIATVDAAMPAFRASILGSRTCAGDALAPMIVTQRPYKFQSECTATGTVLVDGEKQKAVWGFNDKGSFDESNFIDYLTRVVAPAYPDLSPENPVLFVVDGVKTHATLAVVRKATELGIRLFLLPPNCTHILQGEDLVNFPVFKNGFNREKLEYMKNVAYTSFILNAQSSNDQLYLYSKMENIIRHFGSLFSDSWMRAFTKENNQIGLRIQGLLNLDMYPLWKNFPQRIGGSARAQVDTSSIPATPARSPSEASSVESRAKSAEERIRSGDLSSDFELSSRPVTGSPGSIRRVLPTMRLVDKMRSIGLARYDDVTEDEFEVIMACLENTLRSTCQKDYVARARGRGCAQRGELTLEGIVERQQQKQPKTVDPEKEKRKNHRRVEREKFYNKLREQVARKKYLDKQLTRDQLTNLAYHLKHLNKVAESVPQNPSREDLEAIVWKGWPELRDFERESINRGAKTQKRRRAALDEEDEVRCVQSTAPVSLGCASCKGRASGCNRCISWRDEGRLPIKKSKSGYAVWAAPNEA